MKIPMNSDLLIWSSIILLAKSAYNDDLKSLIESKPDVNIHDNKRTHFWVIVQEIDPEKFDPVFYEYISDAVKKEENFHYVEAMNQFRSCKEHADINDELFYQFDDEKFLNPISTRVEELKVS